MEFNKRDIHTSVLKTARSQELTIDDDFNIPDNKKDMNRIIAETGNISVEEVIAEEGRVRVTGTVYFKVLYETSDEAGMDIEVYENEIPFEDVVNIEGVNRASRVETRCVLEDLSAGMINSRKLEVRGLINNQVNVYEDVTKNCAVDLENGNGIECQHTDINISEIMINKRDVFKIKEEIEISQNKPNINEVLWSNVALRNIETRAMEDKIAVRGEVEIFVIYRGSEEHMPVQYIFSVRTIEREIECMGAGEDMIACADLSIGKGDVTVKQDEDGEDRILAVEYNVDMNIKMYEDEMIGILSDMYSPQVEIEPKTEHFTYENLVMKNTALVKLTDRYKHDSEEGKLLSICHIYGDVFIDDIKENETSVNVLGTVKTYILFIPSSDSPMDCIEVDIPFEQTIDTVKLSEDYSVRVIPRLMQLSATMTNSLEIEIKAQVGLEIMIFETKEIDVITDMTISPIDYARKAAMPGIAGYVVKKGDTIWSIARKYYATTESIRSINDLTADEISEGDRIIVVKS
ncbi:MAG: DUF3794 domain-containing protein [Lachnospiraceae bacterium]|nr:DUF3794 domain-containing protein [Lachnospiraceae bacterium]